MPESLPVLPSFREPPIVESVLGVEFDTLESWSILAFGEFWQAIRESYPTYELQPPIGAAPGGELTIEYGFPGKLPVRCWFKNTSDSQLLQVQDDRFLYNWRNYVTEDKYPRYEEKLRPEFIKEWETFCSFLSTKSSEMPKIKSCQITYVNHLEQGKEWEKLDDIVEAFAFLNGSFQVGSLSSLNFQLAADVPSENLKVQVSIAKALRNSDSKEIVQFSLTGIAVPESSDLDSILNCLDKIRRNLVVVFKNMTSEKMHQRWGLEDV
ncbi:TIGR04255 family protein [Halomicronema sp. CCY15110]|uniref:TIGR04255 family protein n=1 Tax=Halomicronema sp. CCY15110 TaxID=2767773 RepID=UPI00194F6AFC|nr:TIGR04255 family protein [Halomicronema sp. CCY15110]